MKRLICLFLCAVLALGLCACAEENAYVPTGDALEYDDDYTGPTATQSADSEQSLTLTYYPDRSMNPLESSDFTNRALFSLLYQSLFTTDRDYELQPQLCKSYHRSEDMKTYEFRLENATFGDGTPLTVIDVVTTLNAARSSSVYSGRFGHIGAITASGDTVVISLSTPYENLPALLDIPILKASEVDASYPMGTGPYILDTSGQPFVLRRNTNWWCSANMVVTAPAIKLLSAQSPTGIRDDFEFADLGLVCADPGSDRYADFRCDYELWDCENHIFLYLACNLKSEVFSEPGLRKALTFAVDRDTITAEYYRGFAYSASLPASPQSPYYSSVLASKYAYDGGVTFAQAVADASAIGKPVIFLVNRDDSLRLRVARFIGQALTTAGLAVQMQELDTAAYTKALSKGEYDIYLGQTKLSPNMDLTPFFANKGALSYGSLSDVALYSLCTESFANYGNYYTLHQKVMDDGRLVPILFRSYAVYATRGLLTGLTPTRDSVFYYSMNKTMEQAQQSFES